MNKSAVPRYQLLLVDPQPERLAALATLLRGLGYGVTCAASVEEGQAILELAKVDAMISISSAEPVRRPSGRASARPTVAVVIQPPADAPSGIADGVLRLPLRAPDLVRIVRRGLDGLDDLDDG